MTGTSTTHRPQLPAYLDIGSADAGRPAVPSRRRAPTTRGRRLRSTPARLTAIAVAAVAACVVLAALVAAQAASQRRGLDEIGNRDAPEVVAGADFYFALNDMDAQVANILLVGDATDLGFTADQAQAIFEQRRAQADADLQQAATAGTDAQGAATVRAVLDAYGRYQSLVARTLLLESQHPHSAGQPDPGSLDAYRAATDLLRSTLLPAARDLSDRNAAALDTIYRRQHDATLWMRAAVTAAGVATLALLVMLQVFLARRFRRRFNPAVIAATLVVLILAAGGTLLLSRQAEDLRAAKKDAFDSILALDRARAVSYDANADESRYLLDPQRADQYQTAFMDKTRQLVDLPGATIDTFDQRLATAIDAYRTDHSDVGWTGFYGTEFRNITFTGERAAAERTLALYQTYQTDDRHIRELVNSGQLPAAIAFCTSYAPGQSNHAFDQYDKALAALIAINQNAFTHTITHADHDLDGWTLVPWLATATIAALVAAGTWRRLGEYR